MKYVFGYKSRYGAFDEIILRKEDADNLQKVVDHLRPKAKEDNEDCKVCGSLKATPERRRVNVAPMFSSWSGMW